MKKILAIFCCLCLTVNIAFAFDPYADEEPEVRSKSKLYWGIFMTLVGGFLAYDGFSQEEVDISKPSVDYGGVINYRPTQNEDGGIHNGYYTLHSGDTKIEGKDVENKIYNCGNVDLYNVKIYVRYRYGEGSGYGEDDSYITQRTYQDDPSQKDKYVRFDVDIAEYRDVDTDKKNAYILAENQFKRTFITGKEEFNGGELAVGNKTEWSDSVLYSAGGKNPPGGLKDDSSGHTYNDNLYFQEEALQYVDVKVTYDYKHKYKKQNKSDIEGVAGLMIATAGIYFIVDYLVDLHKFNRYMKRNDINIRLANAPNEYKLLFQKRL